MLNIVFGWKGVVVVDGGVEAALAAAALSFLDGVCAATTLDCSPLYYISSAGLGVRLKTQKRLKANAGQLRLTGVNRHVHDIFRYAGFDQIFEISAEA